ncbi:hypothetical protein ABIC60_004096 [Phyllobacterium ifriqiyense]
MTLTALLFQKGSAESLDPDSAADNGTLDSSRRGIYPAWMRQSYILRWIYRYSLGLALFFLFVASFIGHLVASHTSHNSKAAMHEGPARTLMEHLVSSQFWFESFQNWQSEFFSTAMLVVLSIFLRFRGSPESKPVSASDTDTGA